jgi:nucleotide-binding universal stress UspA family protein
MLNLKKILLPVDIPLSSFSVLHEAATLARHFKSEIVLLHVATALSHSAGVPTDSREMACWDLLAAINRQAQQQSEATLDAALEGLTIRCKLATGEVAKAIVQTAQEMQADLIMMPSHSFTFYQFLLGSVTAKVLQGTECPVWTGAHAGGLPDREFVIRNVLCAVEFGPRADAVVSWGSQMAAEFNARLTLANVTAGVQLWGPGGDYVDQRMKGELLSNASQQMEALRQQTGVKAEVIIGSGDVGKVLRDAVERTKADLLISGCYPYGGRLRTHGYAIICAVPIPLLSV